MLIEKLFTHPLVLWFSMTALFGGWCGTLLPTPAVAMYNGESSGAYDRESTDQENHRLIFQFPATEFTGIHERLPVNYGDNVHGLDNVGHLYACHKEMVEWTRDHLGVADEVPAIEMGESLISILNRYTPKMEGLHEFVANRVAQAIQRICTDTSRNTMPGASYDSLYTLRCLHRVAELADICMFFGSDDKLVTDIMTNFCVSLNDMEIQPAGTCTQGRFWRLVLPLRELFSQQHYMACLYAQRFYEDHPEEIQSWASLPFVHHIRGLFETGKVLSGEMDGQTRAHLLDEMRQPLDLDILPSTESPGWPNVVEPHNDYTLGLTEDEELALAQCVSQGEPPSSVNEDDEDQDLALAIALSMSMGQDDEHP